MAVPLDCNDTEPVRSNRLVGFTLYTVDVTVTNGLLDVCVIINMVAVLVRTLSVTNTYYVK